MSSYLHESISDFQSGYAPKYIPKGILDINRDHVPEFYFVLDYYEGGQEVLIAKTIRGWETVIASAYSGL